MIIWELHHDCFFVCFGGSEGSLQLPSLLLFHISIHDYLKLKPFKIWLWCYFAGNYRMTFLCTFKEEIHPGYVSHEHFTYLCMKCSGIILLLLLREMISKRIFFLLWWIETISDLGDLCLLGIDWMESCGKSQSIFEIPFPFSSIYFFVDMFPFFSLFFFVLVCNSCDCCLDVFLRVFLLENKLDCFLKDET